MVPVLVRFDPTGSHGPSDAGPTALAPGRRLADGEVMNTHGLGATAPRLVPGIVIRSIRPDDATRLHAFHARLSDDTIRNRFFGAHRVLPDAEVRRFTSPVPGNDAALVATLDEEIVAVGRYNRFGGDDAAEVAFVVQDA